jgi:hypothetical protein
VVVERLGCDVFITADRGFEDEHELKSLSFGIVIVHVTRNKLMQAVGAIRAGHVVHVYGLPAN